MILSTSQPVPLAVKYFFDLLDDQAAQHNITDPETIHIWKTNRLVNNSLRINYQLRVILSQLVI